MKDTIEDVKAKLAEVSEKIGDGDAHMILHKAGGLQKKTQTVEDVTIKRYGRVIRACDARLKAHQAGLDKVAAAATAKAAAAADLEHEGKECRQIANLIRDYDAKIADAASVPLRQQEDKRIMLAQRLAAIKPKCKAAGMSFADFKAEYVGDVILGRTQLYQLLKIGRGEITQDQVRLLESEKKATQRAAAKVSGTGTKSRTDAGGLKTAGGDAIDPASLGPKAREQLAAAAAAGNDVDTDASAQAIKDAAAAEDGDGGLPPETVAETDPAPAGETSDERMDRQLAEWKAGTAVLWKGWNEATRENARASFIRSYSKVPEVRRRAA